MSKNEWDQKHKIVIDGEKSCETYINSVNEPVQEGQASNNAGFTMGLHATLPYSISDHYEQKWIISNWKSW